MVHSIINYFQRLSQTFWVNNYLASLVYFILFGQDEWSQLVLYPIVVALIHITNQYLNQPWIYRHVGFQAVSKKDWQLLLINFLLNIVVWNMPGVLILVCLLFVGVREYNARQLHKPYQSAIVYKCKENKLSICQVEAPMQTQAAAQKHREMPTGITVMTELRFSITQLILVIYVAQC